MELKAQTQSTLSEMTPDKALNLLKEGNQRFLEGQKAERNLLEQMAITSKGQFPFAVVLGCIDSRVPPELIFDLGIGDIFSIRIAGNFVNQDILGSMEFACKVVGSKLILVLGHTSCGAIRGAYEELEMGNLTGLLEKLKPAVDELTKDSDHKDSVSLDKIAEVNVKLAVEQIKQRSPMLKAMLDSEMIGISGAMYEVESGKVSCI